MAASQGIDDMNMDADLSSSIRSWDPPAETDEVFGQPLRLVGGDGDEERSIGSHGSSSSSFSCLFPEDKNDHDLPLDASIASRGGSDAFQATIDAGHSLLAGLWGNREVASSRTTASSSTACLDASSSTRACPMDEPQVSRQEEAAQVSSGDEGHPHGDCHSPESLDDSDRRTSCEVKGDTTSVSVTNQGGRQSSNLDSAQVSTSKNDHACLVHDQPLHLVGGNDVQHSMGSRKSSSSSFSALFPEHENDRDLPLDGGALQGTIDVGNPLLIDLWEDREITIKDATEVLPRQAGNSQPVSSGDEYHSRSENNSPESQFDSDRSTQAASPGQLVSQLSSKESSQGAGVSVSQIFGEILRGFREKRHYDDDEEEAGGAVPAAIDEGDPLLMALGGHQEIMIKDATEVVPRQVGNSHPVSSGDEYHSRSENNSPESQFDSDRSTQAASPDMDENQDQRGQGQLVSKPSSKECSTMSELFGEILRGFREKRHYEDGEKVETEPPASNYSRYLVSPDPLAPEVEQRHREARNRDGSKLDTAQLIQPGEASRVDPRPNQAFNGECSNLHPRAPLQLSPQAAQPQVAQPQAAQPQAAQPRPSTNKIKTSTSHEEPAASAKRGTKRGTKRKDEDPSPCSETTAPAQEEEVGLGFFSKLQENGLFDQVLGSTGVKKKRKKAAKRQRKPKPDPLEGVGMGFFSGQMSDKPKEEGEKKDISDRIQPLYNWAPVLDERTLAQFEFASPFVLPLIAFLTNFKSFAWAFCVLLPPLHTVEALITNFGPNASKFHLSYAPLNPFVHMCIDLCLNLPMCVACFVCPEPFGKHATLIGTIFFVLNYVYWAVSYQNIVARRKAQAKQLKAQ